MCATFQSISMQNFSQSSSILAEIFHQMRSPLLFSDNLHLIKSNNIADKSKSGILNLSFVLKRKCALPLNLVACKFSANHLQYWPRYFSKCVRLFGFLLFCI